MARSSSATSRPRRIVTPDQKYHSTKVTKLINRAMIDGKKSIATAQIYLAFEVLEKQLKRPALDVLDEVVRNITPAMEVRSRRVGGASYQVPMPVRPARQYSLATRWLVEEARKRSNSTYHTFGEKLAAEMLDALKNEGGAIAKKMTMHKSADANKAFAHFRW